MWRKTEKNLSAVAVVMGIVKNTLISLSISVNMPLADGTFRSISAMVRTLVTVNFWGAKGAPIFFSEIGFCMASCSYIYIYVYICHQDGGAPVPSIYSA